MANIDVICKDVSKEEAVVKTMVCNCILRDLIDIDEYDPKLFYVSDEHKQICDLFDTYINLCVDRDLALEKAKPEYKEVTEKYYGLDLFKKACDLYGQYYDDGTQFNNKKVLGIYDDAMKVLGGE